MQRRINIKQHEHFPYQLMLVGDVGMRRDFAKSTKDHPVQERDKETGLPIWEAEVVNTDPEARKSDRSFTVKLIAEHQPVPPAAADGSTMRPVVFANLEGLPWMDDRMCNGKDQPHKCRARLTWSYRATGFIDTDQESGKDQGSATSAASDSTRASSSATSTSGGKSSRSAA